MRCLCEHYRETANGYCCLERQRLLDESAELKEKLARANAEIKRLRAERNKAPLEGAARPRLAAATGKKNIILSSGSAEQAQPLSLTEYDNACDCS